MRGTRCMWAAEVALWAPASPGARAEVVNIGTGVTAGVRKAAALVRD
ncbi:hypothetical protein [Streptomyces sp. NPDC059828]